MPSTDIQITLGADASGLVDGVDQAKDALDGLNPALAGLAEPAQAFQQAVANAFGATVQGSAAAAEAVSASWTGALDPLGRAFASTTDRLLNGTESFSEAFLRMGDQMLSRFLGWCLEMAERWAVKELAQTAASATGDATRAAGETAAQGVGLAESAATALADIGNSGARAAAGAYAATATVPIVGPALAPAAAAGALGAVLAFGAEVVSAAGGWGRVPFDGAPALLHRNEMVLPAALATPLRDQITAGALGATSTPAARPGDTYNLAVSALDSRSIRRLMDSPATVRAAAAAFARHG